MPGIFGRTTTISDASAFVFEVKTTGTDETFTLPIYNGGTYDFNVDWGDSSNDDIAAWDNGAKVHTYATADTYTVTITGTITGWRFANGGDKTKIYDISSWGPLLLGNLNGYFQGCTNLTVSATDVLDLTGTTTLYRAFSDCNSIITLDVSSWDVSEVTNLFAAFVMLSLVTLDVSLWNISKVTEFSYAFHNCSELVGLDVSAWDTGAAINFTNAFWNCRLLTTLAAYNFDIANATNMTKMFDSVTLTTVTYDATIIAWQGRAHQDNVTAHFGGSVLTLGGAAETARDALVADGWTITDSTGEHT